MDGIFKFIKKIVPVENRTRLRSLLANIWPWDLDSLAIIHGTDKWDNNFYTPCYNAHFQKIRFEKLKVLEIGVGCFDNPLCGGESLRMWKNYFPNSTIYGIDICDKTGLQEDRIKIFQGSQADEVFLKKVCEEHGPFDIIIDDGSHISCHIVTSFNSLFPHLKEGGYYAIEDLHVSYNKEWADKKNMEGVSSVDFITSFIKDLHIENNKKIAEIHFYHYLAIIQKENTQIKVDPLKFSVSQKLKKMRREGGEIDKLHWYTRV